MGREWAARGSEQMPSSRWWVAALAVACVGGGGGPAVEEGVPVLPPAGVNIGPVVARVGEPGVVGANEFLGAAVHTLREKGGTQLTPEERRAVLDEMVEEEALFQEAARLGLHRDPKVRKTLINLLLRQEVYSQVKAADFSEEDMKAYFDAHREEFVVPEKVHVKKIFIAIDERRSADEALAMATEVRQKVVGNPGRFKELAAEYSEDTWKRRGGDLSYVSREGSNNGIDPAVVEAAFALPVGGVSAPFLAGGGYNVVLNAAHRERVERGFGQMEGAVLREMKTQRTKELLEEYTAKILARYPAEIDSAALEAIDLAVAVRVPVDAPGDGVDEVVEEVHEEEEN